MRIRLSGLGKTYRRFGRPVEAVRDVDLEIESGELFVLLGPSGCGKSTLLELVAGLERPTRGEIRFDDRLVASAAEGISSPPRDRDVAMVFQSYALYPHLDVSDNIGFPLEVGGAGGDEVEERVRRAASTLGIEDLLAARPKELSGGQRQRVAIARAIVREPRAFLLDEPLSNLDAQLRASTRIELKELQDHLGVTTLYVTHDQVEAMTLGHRIAVLRGGRIEQVGGVEDLYHRPASPFVARFVGAPQMSLVEARLESGGGAPAVRVGRERIEIPDEARERFADVDGEFLFGIRPEDVRLVGAGEGHASGEILAVESLGREHLLHLDLGAGVRLSALADEGPEVGRAVRLHLRLERAHAFDRGTE